MARALARALTGRPARTARKRGSRAAFAVDTIGANGIFRDSAWLTGGRAFGFGIGTMFAVVKTGGKQYKVAPDDVIKVEKLPAEAGAEVTLDQVLMVGDGDNVTVGAPTVAGATVTATVLEQTRGKKIIVFKKRRRQDSRVTKGPRQDLTVLRIGAISPDGKPAKKKAAAKKKPRRPPMPRPRPPPRRRATPTPQPRSKTWPIKKQVVAPVTAATARAGAWALKSSAARS